MSLSAEDTVSKNRYHIHIVCADNDQLLFLDSLAIFFQSRAFLTYDVSSKLPKASLYGRQCIDACDYVILVIGDSYGTTQSSGVSQMHLSYLSAKAKTKPLMKLIKTQEAIVSRQLQAFTQTVEKQAKHIYYYDEDTDIDQLLSHAYNDMITNYDIADSWSRAVEQTLSSYTQRSTPKPTAHSSSNNIPSSISTTRKSISANQKNAVVTYDDSDNSDQITQQIELAATVSVQYNAQAYEAGNLTDVTRLTKITWQEILGALVKMPETFSSYGLQSCFNRLIASKAETEIKIDMPNVHAVARCQIAQKDLNELQRQLIAANWIQISTFGARVTQELWKLTFYGRSIFKESEKITKSSD